MSSLDYWCSRTLSLGILTGIFIYLRNRNAHWTFRPIHLLQPFCPQHLVEPANEGYATLVQSLFRTFRTDISRLQGAGVRQREQGRRTRLGELERSLAFFGRNLLMSSEGQGGPRLSPRLSWYTHIIRASPASKYKNVLPTVSQSFLLFDFFPFLNESLYNSIRRSGNKA